MNTKIAGDLGEIGRPDSIASRTPRSINSFEYCLPLDIRGGSPLPRTESSIQSLRETRPGSIEHEPETTLTTSAEPPILRVYSIRATSRRSAWSGSPGVDAVVTALVLAASRRRVSAASGRGPIRPRRATCAFVSMSRSIVAVFVQPCFPDGTGIFRPKGPYRIMQRAVSSRVPRRRQNRSGSPSPDADEPRPSQAVADLDPDASSWAKPSTVAVGLVVSCARWSMVRKRRRFPGSAGACWHAGPGNTKAVCSLDRGEAPLVLTTAVASAATPTL